VRAMAKPSKVAQALAEGDRLRELVNAYRAAKGEASLSSDAPASDGNKQTPTEKKSYPLPPLERPTELPDYPLNPAPARPDVPDYGNMARLKASRAAQAARLGKHAPLRPSGPPKLRKRKT
jgi:hypothetical protein